MIIGLHGSLKNNNLGVGDTVWACAYVYTSTKENKGLHQHPILGVLSHTKYEDTMQQFLDKNKYKPNFFIPFKKNAKSLTYDNLQFSKAVRVESRRYATTEEECKELYNKAIQSNINWHTMEIEKLKKDML